jgi:hypothetical protein
VATWNCRASSTRSLEEMAGEYSLAKIDLLLGLGVVWLGRHDGGYLCWCGVCVLEVWSR